MMRRKVDDTMLFVDPNYELYFLNSTDYFPHVREQDILLGFYSGLNSIQGNGGVYWATTLLTFESINNSIEMAQNFVARYFPYKN